MWREPVFDPLRALKTRTFRLYALPNLQHGHIVGPISDAESHHVGASRPHHAYHQALLPRANPRADNARAQPAQEDEVGL